MKYTTTIVTTLVLSLSTLLHAREAAAELTYEVRAPIGASLVRPSGLNDRQPAPLKIQYAGNFGADAIVDFGLVLPVLGDGVGMGLRYDSVSAIRADGALKDGDAIEVVDHLFSLLFRKRWAIDENKYLPRYLLQYLAVNSSVAIYAPSVVNTHTAAGPWVQYRNNHLGQFSLGAEAGWIWDPFLVASEIGYQSIYMTDLTNDQGAHLTDVDMSGAYVKIILGLRFR